MNSANAWHKLPCVLDGFLDPVGLEIHSKHVHNSLCVGKTKGNPGTAGRGLLVKRHNELCQCMAYLSAEALAKEEIAMRTGMP